jgi:hypothetical protein
MNKDCIFENDMMIMATMMIRDQEAGFLKVM